MIWDGGGRGDVGDVCDGAGGGGGGDGCNGGDRDGGGGAGGRGSGVGGGGGVGGEGVEERGHGFEENEMINDKSAPTPLFEDVLVAAPTGIQEKPAAPLFKPTTVNASIDHPVPPYYPFFVVKYAGIHISDKSASLSSKHDEEDEDDLGKDNVTVAPALRLNHPLKKRKPNDDDLAWSNNYRRFLAQGSVWVPDDGTNNTGGFSRYDVALWQNECKIWNKLCLQL